MVTLSWFELQQVASLGEGANFDVKLLKRFVFLVFIIAFIHNIGFSRTSR